MCKINYQIMNAWSITFEIVRVVLCANQLPGSKSIVNLEIIMTGPSNNCRKAALYIIHAVFFEELHNPKK